MIKNILIVDDDPDIREMLGVSLSLEGYSVRLAPDRDVALKMFKQFEPDATFLDWSMSGLGIEEYLREVRGINPKAMIILVTARDRAAHKARELGLPYFLAKPFEFIDVLALLQTCVR